MRLSADVVVIGAGVAGLRSALALASRRHVLLLTKTALATGGASARAQGGIAAAVGPGDSPRLHSADTLAAGDGLCDPAAVDVLVREGPDQVRALAALGTRFDQLPDGSFALGCEGAHSRSRILHANGDATGAEMVRALAAALATERAAGRVEVVEWASAADLVVVDGRCAGVAARLGDGTPLICEAAAVILATGGAGQVYARTTNPPESTGDGVALAWRAGARLRDLEFVQFHPTALHVDADPLPLLSEAIRGERAVLVDGSGTRFMPGEHPQGELAPRDVVARAVWRRLQAGGRVFLDATRSPGEAFAGRFPGVFALCQRHGLDPRRDPLPVTPAAHYLMGGVAVDLVGRSSLPGLYACGEVACSGVHGANRLASNSLLESVVFADRVARDILATERQPIRLPEDAGAAAIWQAPDAATLAARTVGEVRNLMWRQVGVERSGPGLRAARRRLAALAAALPPGPSEAANSVLVARLIAAAALARRESRGSHWRVDHATVPRRRAG